MTFRRLAALLGFVLLLLVVSPPLFVIGCVLAMLGAMTLGTAGLVQLLDIIKAVSVVIRRQRAYQVGTYPIVALDDRLRRLSHGHRYGWPRRAFYLAATPLVALSLPVGWALWYVYFSSGDRPDIRVVLDYAPLQIGNISDSRGEVMIKMTNDKGEYRRVVSRTDIKDEISNAFVAIEDGDFWTNDGWEKDRTLAAAFKSTFGKWLLGTRSQGGSTITQQVVRKVDPTTLDLARREKHAEPLVDSWSTRIVARLMGRRFANQTTRKWREIKRSHHLESGLVEHFRKAGVKNPKRAAKEAILTVYLNEVYFGQGVYGVDYAAEFYFQKKLNDLTVEEAAYLATLLPAPEKYSAPDITPAAQKARRDQGLARIRKRDFIDEARYAHALTTPVTLDIRRITTKTGAPAAVNTVLFRELPKTKLEQEKLLQGGIQIQTTIRMDLQRIVNEAAYHGLHGDGKKFTPTKKQPKKPETGWVERYPDADIPQVAIVVMGLKGEILAMYGGDVRDSEGQYNAHVQLNRAWSLNQAGSTWKAVDSMAAMVAGFTPDTELTDDPISVRMGNGTTKEIANYEEERLGRRPLREFSARSVNTAYMRLMGRGMVGKTKEAKEAGALMTAEYGQRVEPGAAMSILWGREMGVESPLQPYSSTILGGSDVTVVDMANVMHSADTGKRAVPYLISRITNNADEELYRNDGHLVDMPVTAEQLTNEQVLLYGNVRLPKGTGHSLDTAEFGIEVAGKTGTTNDWRDAWYVGYTHNGIYIAVHVGYDNNKPMPGEGLPIWRRASGGWVALPIFREIMEKAYGLKHPLGIPEKMPDAVKDNVKAYLATAYPVTAK